VRDLFTFTSKVITNFTKEYYKRTFECQKEGQKKEKNYNNNKTFAGAIRTRDIWIKIQTRSLSATAAGR
jgi:hypothetical protein